MEADDVCEASLNKIVGRLKRVISETAALTPHPAIDSRWNTYRVVVTGQPATDRGRAM